MKKYLFIALFILFPVIAQAVADCPFGETNDPFPGECTLYVDANHDGVCDYSEVEEMRVGEESSSSLSCSQMKTMTVASVADFYEIDKEVYASEIGKYLKTSVKSTDNFTSLIGKYGLDTDTAKGIAYSLKLNIENKQTTSEVSRVQTRRKYSLFPVSLILLFVYLVSFLLSRYKKITVLTHRKVWNILLTISFLGVGISGIFLVLRVNYGLSINWPFNLLFWHVETGITMTLISIFHIIWHWPYYKNMLNKK